MVNYEERIHRNMLILWGVISGVLAVSYFGEVLKGLRSMPYYMVFMLVTMLPLAGCIYLHRTGKLRSKFPIIMVAGYFFTYVFVLMTGSTTMVFSYILPLLSFLVLCHQAKLVLVTGIAALTVNMISIAHRVAAAEITLENSKDVEIQLALIILCFMGAWVSARMYDRITRDNEAYIKKILTQSEQISTQQDQLAELEIDIQQMDVTAHTDFLTGIGNRLAFERLWENLPKDSFVGVIFCDINALKYINDTDGHEAGDRLLTDFTSILLKEFRRQDCYRVSGDEFFCILTDISEAVFLQRARNFHDRIHRDKPPKASLGWAYGEPTAAVRTAERYMYDDKQKFYTTYPQYRR